MELILSALKTLLAWAGWSVLVVVSLLFAWITLSLLWTLVRLGWHELRRRRGVPGLGPPPRLPAWLRG